MTKIFKEPLFWVVIALLGGLVLVLKFKPELILDEDKVKELAG